jgi:hypothetical protein
MTPVTLNRALVARHAAGRADAYDAALLDVAQDHLLWVLAQLGQFGDGAGLIFKGGGPACANAGSAGPGGSPPTWTSLRPPTTPSWTCAKPSTAPLSAGSPSNWPPPAETGGTGR